MSGSGMTEDIHEKLKFLPANYLGAWCVVRGAWHRRATPHAPRTTHYAPSHHPATLCVVMASYDSDMTVSLAVPDILVARAQAGDEEALEALYRAFETPVYNLARRMLKRPEDAEDVLQETFLEVVRSIKQYRGEGHLWGWIRQIATSKALMRIRHDRLPERGGSHGGWGVGGGAKGGAGDVAGGGTMGGAGGMSPGAVPAQI